MKGRFFIGFIICIAIQQSCFAQLQIQVEKNWVTNKGLYCNVKLINEQKETISIRINSQMNIMQLPFPIRDKQLSFALQNSFPISFVVFSYNDSIIDDYVFSINHGFPQYRDINIASGIPVVLEYLNNCIGDKTWELIENKKDLCFEFYIVYIKDGEIKYVKTPRTKISYDN